MDIQMPEIDGLEATEIIRAIEKNQKAEKPIKIVAMTANTMKDDQKNSNWWEWMTLLVNP
jgi:two-component system sensor histidine kinase/response regulator